MSNKFTESLKRVSGLNYYEQISETVEKLDKIVENIATKIDNSLAGDVNTTPFEKIVYDTFRGKIPKFKKTEDVYSFLMFQSNKKEFAHLDPALKAAIDTLGITEELLNEPENQNKSFEDIVKTQYRKWALVYHPDKQKKKSDAEKAEAEESFKKLNNANELLQKDEYKDIEIKKVRDLLNEKAQDNRAAHLRGLINKSISNYNNKMLVPTILYVMSITAYTAYKTYQGGLNAVIVGLGLFAFEEGVTFVLNQRNSAVDKEFSDYISNNDVQQNITNKIVLFFTNQIIILKLSQNPWTSKATIDDLKKRSDDAIKEITDSLILKPLEIQQKKVVINYLNLVVGLAMTVCYKQGLINGLPMLYFFLHDRANVCRGSGNLSSFVSTVSSMTTSKLLIGSGGVFSGAVYSCNHYIWDKIHDVFTIKLQLPDISALLFGMSRDKDLRSFLKDGVLPAEDAAPTNPQSVPVGGLGMM